MLQHLLYVVAPSRLEAFKQAMTRLKAEPLSGSSITNNYRITHRLLDGLVLKVSLLADLDGITPYLRQNPVDLLIYDERGDQVMPAAEAVRRIRKDVNQLAELWGPDFNFPTSRIVTVLRKSAQTDHQVFELGRLSVRDVIIEPRNTAFMLRWLKNVLYHGIIRTNKVGIALSGGAIEGFLYQIGVLHALDCAVMNRDIHMVDVVSGVSSGSIAGAMIATKLPIIDMLRAIHDLPSKAPKLKLSSMFDFAGVNIFRRFTKVWLSFRKTPITQWISSLTQSIPTGFIKGEKFEKYIEDVLATYQTPTIFQDLDLKFYVGVTDQDNFKHVVLGQGPFIDCSIAASVRASSALPPLLTPRTIKGRNYIDGQITRSCNLESVVEEGARLVFIIDPLKPLKSTTAGTAEQRGGFYGIVQMIKALVSTRFETSLKAISEQYPDVDFLVFQPDEECARLMAGSPLRTKFRVEIIESSFRSTLRKLRERHHVYYAKMSRYGFYLKDEEELRQLEGNYYGILDPHGSRNPKKTL